MERRHGSGVMGVKYAGNGERYVQASSRVKITLISARTRLHKHMN